MNFEKFALVITAGGSSSRFGTKKEFVRVLHDGKKQCLLQIAVEKFIETFDFSQIVITMSEEFIDYANELLGKSKKIVEYQKKGRFSVIAGGKTRQLSVFFALDFIKKQQNCPNFVLIHDGARPFVSSETILNVINDAKKFDASCPCVECVDTPKEVSFDGQIIRHLERKTIFNAQTPQGFRFEKLFDAHKKAMQQSREWTDDSEIWAAFNSPVHISKGNIENKKITFQSDLVMEKIFRIGLGYDIHELVEGRKLILAGIEIPFEKGEKAHSDGDVAIHAICDAILGATGKSDIGELFPDSDDKWKDSDSSEILKTVWKMLQKDNWEIENLDCVINLEVPKILSYRKKMIEKIAKILEISETQVFIKAKTGEKLGVIGNKQAVACWATALLSKNI